MTVEHVFIPDTQIRPGVPLDHLEAAGNYIADRRPDRIILAGDWWDMHSLSSYDVGRKAGEGARYQDDIDAGRAGLDRFMAPLRRVNVNRRRQHLRLWEPELHFLIGNHEQRIERHVNNYPILEGKLSYADFGLEREGIRVHDFLHPCDLDGILYSHYFPRNTNGRIVQTYRGSPSALQQVKREMQSCSSGHLQGVDIHFQQTMHGLKIGLIAGSFYMHEEDYLSPQGTGYWRGIIYKHQVSEGSYDPLFVSMSYLLKEWL